MAQRLLASFAWSRDGRLLAISHSIGLISLVDVMRYFTTVAETTTSQVCEMLKFTTDSQHLFLYSCDGFVCDLLMFRFSVVSVLLMLSVTTLANFNLSLSVDFYWEILFPLTLTDVLGILRR